MDSFACLDCRRLYPVETSGGTGYAVLGDRDPSEVNHFVCYGCADSRERADMATADRFFAYLSSDGRTVTTWTGAALADVTSERERRVGFGGCRVYVRATDRTGRKWYGNGPGRGMYVRLRRLGPKTLKRL